LESSCTLLESESLLLAVIARLITDHVVPWHRLRNTGREHAAIRLVREWLDAHSEKDVSIKHLADLAGLSPYYLVRVFHKQLGVPPHRYQTIVRINRARALLVSGEPITDVAYRTGFCDQSHLNRCFKSMLGVTPGQYALSSEPPITLLPGS
jgi:transcriptional regulator GlxA family with amidase domain